ncbi:hypothetical protein BJ165DRAFT_1534685 [Panaeolus papilionaceus]|nr:hypothetical protein BJ165DRAFT_1534685 [Panaeolus papilionaceus]
MASTTPTLNGPTTEFQSNPVLPFELFHMIIDDVAGGLLENYYQASVRADVIALSLVCHTFNQLCRSHLFRLVVIDVNARNIQQRSLERLASILTDLPSLAQRRDITSFIQEVRYTGSEWEENRDGNLRRPTAIYDSLLGFQNVKILKIGLRRLHSYQYADERSFGFRALLDNCIASGNLTYLFIGRVIRVPIFKILACPNLRTLHIKGCSLVEADFPDAPPEGRPYALESFTGRGGRMGEVTLSALAACSKLKHLQLSYDENSSEELNSLRSSVRSYTFPSLESFTYNQVADWSVVCEQGMNVGVKVFPKVKKVVYNHPKESSYMPPNFVFQNFMVLQELHVQGSKSIDFELLKLKDCISNCRRTLESVAISWSFDTYTDCHFLVSTLYSSLESVEHGNNALQNMELQLNFQSTAEINTEHDFNFEPWRRLDRVLAGDRRRFPGLKTVTLNLFSDTHGEDEINSAVFEERFRTSLTNLQLGDSIVLHARMSKP